MSACRDVVVVVFSTWTKCYVGTSLEFCSLQSTTNEILISGQVFQGSESDCVHCAYVFVFECFCSDVLYPDGCELHSYCLIRMCLRRFYHPKFDIYIYSIVYEKSQTKQAVTVHCAAWCKYSILRRKHSRSSRNQPYSQWRLFFYRQAHLVDIILSIV